MAIAYVGQGTYVTGFASLSPTIPSVSTGDLLLLVFCSKENSADIEPISWPSGWTVVPTTGVYKDTSVPLNYGVAYRVVDGTEGSSATVDINSHNGAWGATIFAYSGVDNSTPFDITSDQWTATAATTGTPDSVTTSTNNSMVVAFCCTADNNTLSLNTANSFTLRVTQATTVGTDHALAAADKVQATAGSVTMCVFNQDSVGPDAWAGLTMALKEAVAATVVTPATVAATAAVPVPTITFDWTTTPATVAAVADLSGHTVSTGTDALVPAATVAAVAGVGIPTVTTASEVTFIGASATYESSFAAQTPAIPAGAQAGDLLLLMFVSRSDVTPLSWTRPAGWTTVALAYHSTADLNIGVAYKIASASDITTGTVSHDINWHNGAWGSQVLAYRYVDGSTPLDTMSVSWSRAANTTAAASGLSTVTNGAMAICIAGTADDNDLAFSISQGFLIDSEVSTLTGTDHAALVVSQIIDTAGAVTFPTLLQNTNGPDEWIGVSLALRPSQPATTIVQPSTVAAVGAVNTPPAIGGTFSDTVIPTSVDAVATVDAPALEIRKNILYRGLGSHLGSDSETTLRPAIPDTAQVGDLLLIHFTSKYTGASLGRTLPSGFTELGYHSHSTGDLHIGAGYKVMEDSDRLLLDDFNRANSSSIGGDWIDVRLSMGIVSNAAAPNSDDGFGTITVQECSTPDGTLRCRFGTTDGLRGLAFRVIDANNYWSFLAFPPFVNTVLTKVVNGIQTTVANIGLSAREYLTVDLIGDQIVLWSSDVAGEKGWHLGTFTDSTHNNTTRHGIFARETTSRITDWSFEGNRGLPITISSAEGGWSAGLVAYANPDPTTQLDVAATTWEAAAGLTAAAADVTTVTDNAQTVSLVGTADDTGVALSVANQFTGRYGVSTPLGTGHAFGLADRTKPTAGLTDFPTWAQTQLGGRNWVGISLALRPDPTSTLSVTVIPSTIEAVAFSEPLDPDSEEPISLTPVIASDTAITTPAAIALSVVMPTPIVHTVPFTIVEVASVDAVVDIATYQEAAQLELSAPEVGISAVVVSPFVTDGSSAGVAPAAVAGVAGVATPTINAGVTVTPDPIAVTTVVGLPTSAVAVEAVTVAGVAGVPAVTPSLPGSPAPAVIAVTASVPAPTIKTSHIVTPTSIAVVTSQPAVTISAINFTNATVTPVPVPVVARVLTPRHFGVIRNLTYVLGTLQSGWDTPGDVEANWTPIGQPSE